MTKKKRDTKTSKRADKSAQKATYRVSNWAAYNDSLVQRGSLTVWISEEVIEEWRPTPQGRRQRGGQVEYSDRAIECLLTLKAVFRLPYRQTAGFGRSIMALLGVQVTVPDYTTLCKRSANLAVDLSPSQMQGAKHIVVDSTGLKVYGEGEWKVRKHGYSKRRTWRKLHLAVDEATGEVEAVVLTEASVDDAAVTTELLTQTKAKVEQLSADGAYDKEKVYQAALDKKVDKITIPPRKDAVLWAETSPTPHPRNATLQRVWEVGSKAWKEESGYHRRSLAETAMFRFKTIFGDRLTAREEQRQKTEARIKSAALNQMTRLGMPESYRVN